MRVLFVSIEWPFYDQPYRGAFAKSLADGLNEFIEVITLPLPIRRNPLNIIKYQSLVRKKFEKYECSHIHCYSINTLLMAHPKKYPVSASAIGSDVFGTVNQKGRYTLTGRMPYLILKNQINHLKGIRCVSEELKQKIQNDFSENFPTTVLPNGVDLNRFPAKSREEACKAIGWDPDCINVYFPGNPNRGVKNYPLAKELIEHANKHVNVCLYPFPKVDLEAMNDYYRAADVVLITSFHEGSSNSLKEALLCNTPVLSTPVGDAPYWLNFSDMGRIIQHNIGLNEFLEALQYFTWLKRNQESSVNKAIAEKIDVNKIAHSFAQFLYKIQ